MTEKRSALAGVAIANDVPAKASTIAALVKILRMLDSFLAGSGDAGALHGSWFGVGFLIQMMRIPGGNYLPLSINKIELPDYNKYLCNITEISSSHYSADWCAEYYANVSGH